MKINREKKKIIFISMNRFGHECLLEMLENGIDVEHIFTINEERAARISDYCDFSEIAAKYDIPLKRVSNINNEVDFIGSLKPDAIFVLGWSQIINKELLSVPKLGCVGAHPSLLPKNRGRAVIPWHFINDEKYGGITFFYLDEGCDSGDIIIQKKFMIGDRDNAKTYYETICRLGRECIREKIADILNGAAQAEKQNNKKATYLTVRKPGDSRIDFQKSSREIFNLIRAVAYVYPAAFFFYKNQKILVYKSFLISGELYISGLPGQIIEISKDCIMVKTGDGIIGLRELVFEDGNKIDLNSFFMASANLTDNKF